MLIFSVYFQLKTKTITVLNTECASQVLTTCVCVSSCVRMCAFTQPSVAIKRNRIWKGIAGDDNDADKDDNDDSNGNNNSNSNSDEDNVNDGGIAMEM